MSFIVTDYNEYRVDSEESYEEIGVDALASRLDDLTGIGPDAAAEAAKEVAYGETFEWGDPENIGRIVTAKEVV